MYIFLQLLQFVAVIIIYFKIPQKIYVYLFKYSDYHSLMNSFTNKGYYMVSIYYTNTIYRNAINM